MTERSNKIYQNYEMQLDFISENNYDLFAQ